MVNLPQFFFVSYQRKISSMFVCVCVCVSECSCECACVCVVYMCVVCLCTRACACSWQFAMTPVDMTGNNSETYKQVCLHFQMFARCSFNKLHQITVSCHLWILSSKKCSNYSSRFVPSVLMSTSHFFHFSNLIENVLHIIDFLVSFVSYIGIENGSYKRHQKWNCDWNNSTDF